jgi:uncharacterized membrane protein
MPYNMLAAMTPPRPRIASIDIVRGLVIVLMALDHTRDFFTNLRFEPEALSHTYPALFLTRWVTHLCAPAFFLLAGVGAYFYMEGHGIRETRRFLLTRGIWLMVLEFTFVGIAWTFIIPWGFFGVIWCLGAAMVILAAATYLRPSALLAVSIATIALHDLTDPVRPTGPWGFLWSLLHVKGPVTIGPIHQFVLFPIVPLCAVMTLGFAIAPLFTDEARVRRTLPIAGCAMLAAFAVLRLTNIYGNPPAGLGGVSRGDWHPQPTLAKTVILFFDVEKYPPSLQYLLMTLGCIALLLWAADRWHDSARALVRPLTIFGRVPLFFYVIHLYVIHTLALVVALVTGQPHAWLLHGAIFGPEPDGYGYGLGMVYAMWLVVLVLLYWPCQQLAALKRTQRYPWLSYL